MLKEPHFSVSVRFCCCAAALCEKVCKLTDSKKREKKRTNQKNKQNISRYKINRAKHVTKFSYAVRYILLHTFICYSYIEQYVNFCSLCGTALDFSTSIDTFYREYFFLNVNRREIYI